MLWQGGPGAGGLLTCIPGGQEAEDSRSALFSVHSVAFTSYMCGNRTQFCVWVFSLS